ncbi:uncharacterized protein LOC135321374 [Camelus dromedarius]|uniref:uncharacterized protein LOC135321374 n=1 Tax=Camelus dromedarius TaxID=9838 RepID=UPI003119C56F
MRVRPSDLMCTDLRSRVPASLGCFSGQLWAKAVQPACLSSLKLPSAFRNTKDGSDPGPAARTPGARRVRYSLYTWKHTGPCHSSARAGGFTRPPCAKEQVGLGRILPVSHSLPAPGLDPEGTLERGFPGSTPEFLSPAVWQVCVSRFQPLSPSCRTCSSSPDPSRLPLSQQSLRHTSPALWALAVTFRLKSSALTWPHSPLASIPSVQRLVLPSWALSRLPKLVPSGALAPAQGACSLLRLCLNTSPSERLSFATLLEIAHLSPLAVVPHRTCHSPPDTGEGLSVAAPPQQKVRRQGPGPRGLEKRPAQSRHVCSCGINGAVRELLDVGSCKRKYN